MDESDVEAFDKFVERNWGTPKEEKTEEEPKKRRGRAKKTV